MRTVLFYFFKDGKITLYQYYTGYAEFLASSEAKRKWIQNFVSIFVFKIRNDYFKRILKLDRYLHKYKVIPWFVGTYIFSYQSFFCVIEECKDDYNKYLILVQILADFSSC